MASRRRFAYDPYGYYYHSPYHYPQGYPYYYYQHHPASAWSAANSKDCFPAGGYDGEPARQRGPRSRSVSVPVQFVGSEPEPGREELRAAAAPAEERARLSEEEAAVRVQAAARGFLSRRMVREVRAVEREAEAVAARVAAEAEVLRGDERSRVAAGEALMRLLLRLDAVRGAREYRRKVTKKVLVLQDAVDALEPRAPAESPESPEEAELAVDMEAKELAGEDGQMMPDSSEDADHGAGMELAKEAAAVSESPVTETAGEVEVADGALDDVEKVDEAEGEWEMVEQEPAAASSAEVAEAGEGSAAPRESTGEKKAEGGAVAGDLDARKMMQMVAALCGRSERQCEAIGALARRADVLERTVRRVEDADRRRRRNKKLKKAGKGAARSCYSD